VTVAAYGQAKGEDWTPDLAEEYMPIVAEDMKAAGLKPVVFTRAALSKGGRAKSNSPMRKTSKNQSPTKLVQIVPVPGIRLFGQMVKKQLEIARKTTGAFYRSGPTKRDRAKWSHSAEGYKGWINLERGVGEVVTAEVRSLSQLGDEWKILHAFIGWVDRHFSADISAIHIHYRP
jgi:hypothetical protein